MPQADHLRTGEWAEAQAATYLEQQGLRPIARNFRCRFGEIDLIMADGPVLVFVEVRFRRSGAFGAGFESVTREKQSKLLRAAQAYLARRRLDGTPCRFDVISVSKRNYRPDFLWLRNAFGQD